MQVISLFSGIGGFDLAAKWLGWHTVAFCEIDPHCRKVLAKHWPGVYIHHDIHTLDYDTLIQQTNWQPTQPTILVGGFPCQPFSVAGKRRGKADDRHLWPQMARLVAELRPRHVLAENVPGLIKLGLDQVLADLAATGYAAQACGVPACAVGVGTHPTTHLDICCRHRAAQAKKKPRQSSSARGGLRPKCTILQQHLPCCRHQRHKMGTTARYHPANLRGTAYQAGCSGKWAHRLVGG